MRDLELAQGIISRFSDLLEPEEKVAVAAAGLGGPLDESLAGILVEHFAARKPRDEKAAHEKAWAKRRANASGKNLALPTALSGWNVDEVRESLLGSSEEHHALAKRLFDAAGGTRRVYSDAGVALSKAWPRLDNEDRKAIMQAARDDGVMTIDPDAPNALAKHFHEKVRPASEAANQASRMAHQAENYDEDASRGAHQAASDAHAHAMTTADRVGDRLANKHHADMFMYHVDRAYGTHDQLNDYKHLEQHIMDLGREEQLPDKPTDPNARYLEAKGKRLARIQPGLEFKFRGMDARVDHMVTPDTAYIYTKNDQGAWQAYAKGTRSEIADIAGFRASEEEELARFAAGGRDEGEAHRKAWLTRKLKKHAAQPKETLEDIQRRVDGPDPVADAELMARVAKAASLVSDIKGIDHDAILTSAAAHTKSFKAAQWERHGVAADAHDQSGFVAKHDGDKRAATYHEAMAKYHKHAMLDAISHEPGSPYSHLNHHINALGGKMPKRIRLETSREYQKRVGIQPAEQRDYKPAHPGDKRSPKERAKDRGFGFHGEDAKTSVKLKGDGVNSCKGCGLHADDYPRPDRARRELNQYGGKCLDCMMSSGKGVSDIHGGGPDEELRKAALNMGRP